MIIPKYLKAKDTIGVTATSNGIVDELKIKRTKNAALNLRNAGYEVVFTDNVFKADYRGSSSTGIEKAKQFNDLMANDDVSVVFAASGGDYLMEMLEYVDFNQIKKTPKWFQGYSDNTGLIFPIVTKADVAAIYGCHMPDFGMKPWDKSVTDALGVLEGKINKLESYDFYENDRHEYETGFEGYAKDKPVKWVNGRGEEKIEMSGRLIGGCLDVIAFIIGTQYDGTNEFIEKYKDDGIIWALETFNMEDVTLITHLWQMKNRGYFKNTKGFIFGRELMFQSYIGQNYQDAVMQVIGDLNVPVIFDADIGHKGPQFPLIIGAKAMIQSYDSKGIIEYI